ncbi:MAG: DUF11 domain-containing protein [Candidatus Thermoplasmatota archaeon]|nr:DUF11 domain-containing protein [Candidatus Thermoplasmatota archaeon]
MNVWGKNARSLRKSNEMVSDIVGTMVLLAISVVIFSSLYGMVLSYPFASDPATVRIIGTIDGNNIILEHRGGEALGLDTTVPITIAGETLLRNGKTPTVRDLLVDTNGDGLWNIGERLVCTFTYDPAKLEADVMAIDVESNSLVLIGTLDIHPESDVGIKVVVDDPSPGVGDTVTVTITATTYQGDMGALDVVIACTLPDELVYVGHDLSQGAYTDVTGMWNVGNLDVAHSATLTLTLKVNATGETTPTQMAMILDGSSSITNENWTIMLDGLAAAIENEDYFPHDGSVELTLIQFGGWKNNRSWAQVEVAPIVVDETNYAAIADTTKEIIQLRGGTAMSCGFYLAADILAGDPYGYLVGTAWEGMASSNEDSFPRKAITVVTDGEPNILCNEGEYNGTWPGGPTQYMQGKANAVIARNYLRTILGMTDDDEFDAVAVGSEPDVPWLRDEIVWPQPGYDTWPSPGPGWVHHVSNYTEFAEMIDEQFKLIFNSITSTIEIVASTPIDPNGANNKVSVILVPQEP